MSTTAKTQITQISPAAAQTTEANSLLLDVRTPLEYTESHIAGSVLHPLSQLDVAQVKDLAAGKSKCIVVCRSGNRATQAAEKLAEAGLSNVEVLAGGVQAWDAAGLPLNRGKAVMSLERQVRIVAGSLVFAGVAMGFLVNSAWFFLSGFVGAGLVFAGVTDFCGMGLLLARMPWNNRSTCKICG